jgi:hypothetical protein
MANTFSFEEALQPQASEGFSFEDALLKEEPEEPKEATVRGEAIKGFKRMGSAYQTLVGSITDPEAATRAAIKREEELTKEYGQQPGLKEAIQAYERDGVLAAGAEVASQIPSALSGQAANLLAIGAGAKTGAVAGAPLGPAGAAIGAGLGAVGTQIASFYEQNLISQLRAQEERGEPVDLNRAKAAAYATVQSSAEIGGTVLAFGKRLIGGIIGTKPAAEATEALVKTAKQSLLAASGKGAARATGAELPVEMAQTILQRHQAGESLTDDDALEDYKNTIYGTILVAGPLGAGAGPINRMQARGEVDRRELLKTQQQETEEETKTETTQAPPVNEVDIEKKIADIEAAGTVPPVDKDEIIYEVAPPPAPVVNAELQAMEAEYAKREEDIKTGPKGAAPNRIKKNAELKQKIEAKKAELAQATAAVVQGDQDATAQVDSTGAGVSTTSAGKPGGRPAAGVVGPDGTGVAVAGDTVQQTQAATEQQPRPLTAIEQGFPPVIKTRTEASTAEAEQQAAQQRLEQTKTEETALDTALAETEGQELPKSELPNLKSVEKTVKKEYGEGYEIPFGYAENFLEEYNLARQDLAARDVKVPEWKNLETDDKDFLMSVLPTQPSAMDYTNALQKLAEYKYTTGRGAGYGQEKVTPTQQRIINGYEEQRPGLRQQFGVDFPAWNDLTPEAKQAYTNIVSSNAPIQQYAGFKAVQDTLKSQGISVFSTDRQQQKQNEQTAQQRAQIEDEKRKAQEAEAVGKGEPLTDEMRAALAKGDINGVLGILAQEANGIKTPKTDRTTESFLSSLADTYGEITAGIFRYLARTLSTMPFKSTVITDVNDSVIQRLRNEGKLAEYDPKTDTFYFTPEGMDEATVLHEVVHAGTVKLIKQYLTDPASLSQGQRDALDHLQKIYDFTKNTRGLGKKYKNAYENLYEFVSYALTDPRFQGELANIQSRNLSKYSSMSELGVMVRNAWGELTRALANLYGLLTGKGKTLQVRPELVQSFSQGMSSSTKETFYEDVDNLAGEQGLTETEVGDFVPGKQTEVKEKKQGYKISKKALLSREKGFEGNLLLEVSEIFNQILAVPEAGIDVSPLAASASGAATAKAPTQMGPSKPASLYDDDLRYLPEKFKTESLVTRIAKAVTPDWVVKKFQNDKQLSKKLENQLGLAGKLKMSGEDRNDSYTIVSLARGISKNLYNEKILPGVTKLETAFNELSKLTKLSNEKLVALIDKVSIAKHEPERRIVKFLKTAPLKPQMADVRQNIFKLLDSNTLSKAQAVRLRKKLDAIMFQVDQNGNPVIGPDGYPVVNTNNVTPLGNSPRDFKTTDVSHADYTVVDMDGASVKNINDEYNNHPQKALIDRVLAAQQEIINSSKELNQTANYVSDPVNNLINFYGWKNYVPMKARFEADGDFDPAHRGREEQENQYSFEGMDKVPDSPLLYVLSDGARAASRAGREGYTLSIKNNVLQGNIRGAVPGDVKNIPFDARDTELKKFKKASTIFHYNKDGSVDVITIKDPAVIDSLRRTYKDSNPLVDAMNIATGFVGKMHTRYNYAFAPMNFVRDALTNSFVLGADFGPGAAAEMLGAMAAKVGAQGGLYKAMRIANMYENGDVKGMRDYASKDAFAKTIVEYLLKGGATAYTSSIALKDQLQELNKELGRGRVIKTRDQFEKFVDVWNNMFEFSSRAAAYGVVKDRFMSQGMSDADAAQRAVGYVKNLANFEQTGEYGKMMGGLFMFFRPAATGAVRAIEAVVPAFPGSLARAVAALPESIKKDPQALARFEKAYAQKQQSARIMVTSLMGLGMMMYYMSAMMSPEDELGRNSVHSDNMKQWSRYARFHIPNEISEKFGMGKDVVFQMPWGFGLGAFAAAGAQIAAAEAGRGTIQEALKNIFTDIALDSFVPLPISKMDATDNPINFVIDSISPSIARPLLQFALNKDGLGRGIYNEPYRRMADAFGAGDRIPEAYKDAARYMFNEMGVDVNPNSLYFMSNSYFDGVGRVFETAYSALGLSGEKPDNIKRDSLLFGSFFGSKGNVDNREWGEVQSQLMKKQANLNGAKTDPEAYFKYMERNPMDEVLVKSYLKDVNGSLKKLQTEAKQIRMMPGLSPKERQEMLEPNRMMQSLIKSNLVEKYKMYGVNP